MEILILETNEIISDTEFRVRYENQSFPETLREEDLVARGAVAIMAAPQPATVEFQSVVRDGVIQDALGNYVQAWKVVELPAEQKVAALAAAKVAKNAQINEWRAKANTSTFTHAGKTIACDALSRSDIDGVANHISLFGTFPASFPGAWKAVDNTYIVLPTIDDFKAMYGSMAAQGTANFQRAQQLKAALLEATTLAEINAITW